MKVLKFGGSSLGTPERIKEVGSIVLGSIKDEPPVIVVSAFQGVTNQLIECARLAERRDNACERVYDDIVKRHRSAIRTLLNGRSASAIKASVDDQLTELHDAIHG